MKKLIGIIGGKGKMGQYFADFFEKNGYEVIISDKKTKLSNKVLAEKADVVIVSVPIGITEKVINEVAPFVKSTGLLMDITSLKTFPMEAMKKTKASFLGCHPLFGPTNSIEGQMAILCKGHGAKWYQWLKDLLKKNHVEIRELTAKKHDHLMSYVQVLSHFSDLVLADVLSKSGLNVSNFLKYQSTPYRLKLDMMGRILDQDPNLYAQIQIQNFESLKVMNSFLNSAKQWTDLVEQKDMKSFEKKFQKISHYLDGYKRLAMEESDWLIGQLNRKKFLETAISKPIKPDKTYELVTLGPENTFSSLAAKKYNSKAKVWHANTITEVFQWVERGVIEKGIVPIENKMTGSVVETSDNLFESKLKIQESFKLPIHHFLATLNKTQKSTIKTIYSHVQPIRQCRQYLKTHLPNVDFVSMPSTAAALKKVASENLYHAAVICSEEALRAFGMAVLDKNIEDYKFNSTRFLIIGKKELPFKKNYNYKTSIAFYFSSDAPGTLHQVLGEFAEANVNMTKIESSANPQIPGGHVFYVDFEGHSNQLNIKKMLFNIKKQVAVLKVLGTY